MGNNQPGRLKIVIDVPKTLEDPSTASLFSDSLLSHAKVNTMDNDEVKISSSLPLHLWGPRSRREIFALADSHHSNPKKGSKFVRKDEQQQPPIKFYDKQDKYYEFTNFSPHPVFLGRRPEVAELIRTSSKYPSEAFNLAHQYQSDVRADWKDVNIQKMDEVLYLKFTQHDGLPDMLLETGNAELIEDWPKDAFWGVGSDGKGQNQLGKALERLRGQLLDECTAKPKKSESKRKFNAERRR
ncbi:hypothetical protein DL96DRAFT_1625331 [Flagelloscypha sp. PMI_526]|nr:hypothetical protein DL96DRAFT_1625331 [Flagelloscypha sp. PMI_526]